MSIGYVFIKFFEKKMYKDLIKYYTHHLSDKLMGSLDVSYKPSLHSGILTEWGLRTRGKIFITNEKILFIPTSLLNSHRRGLLGKGFSIRRKGTDNETTTSHQKVAYCTPPEFTLNQTEDHLGDLILTASNLELGKLTVKIFGRDEIKKIRSYFDQR